VLHIVRRHEFAFNAHGNIRGKRNQPGGRLLVGKRNLSVIRKQHLRGNVGPESAFFLVGKWPLLVAQRFQKVEAIKVEGGFYLRAPIMSAIDGEIVEDHGQEKEEQ